jgi:hypothetical protein
MPDIQQPLPQINYFKEEDILHLLISEEPESASVEISPNVTADLLYRSGYDQRQPWLCI